MASLKEDRIDVSKLESNVQHAMDAENLYWLRNDAKFRAVKQKGTYDEFRDIVAAAHLKPLDKTDKIQLDEKIVSPWNPTTDGKKAVDTGAGKRDIDSSSANNKAITVPKNCHEFVKAWRTLKCSTERLAYLQNISKQLPAIFKNEIPFGMFGEFLVAMDSERDSLSDDDLTSLLTHLASSGRFSLSLSFLSSVETLSAQRLLGSLDSSDERTNQLIKLYQL